MAGDNLKQVMNIAHRGASAYVYENTIESLEKAIELGADAVEFDLRRTVDGVIVLWHDSSIRDRSGKWSPVSKTTFDDLHLFASKHNIEPARFEDVLRIFGTRISFDIEIKKTGFELEVVSMLNRYPPVFKPVISSFHIKTLRRLKQIDGQISTSLILGSRFFNMPVASRMILRRIALKSYTDSIKLKLIIASKKNIAEINRAGKPAYVWTVNDKEDMLRIMKAGAVGIITDKPDVLNEVRENAPEPVLRFSDSAQL